MAKWKWVHKCPTCGAVLEPVAGSNRVPDHEDKRGYGAVGSDGKRHCSAVGVKELFQVHVQDMSTQKFKPHDLASLKTDRSSRRRVVEIISYPFPASDEGAVECLNCKSRDWAVSRHPSEPNEDRFRCNQCKHQWTREQALNERVKVRMVPGEPTTLAEVAVADLLPHQRKRYVHVALVSGTFCFPEDMLRYDGAALYDHELNESGDDGMGLRPPVKEGESPRWQCLVYCLSDRKTADLSRPGSPWTKDRWHSFSCGIRPMQVRDLRTGVATDLRKS